MVKYMHVFSLSFAKKHYQSIRSFWIKKNHNLDVQLECISPKQVDQIFSYI